jgi:hypothetical protein
MLETLFKRGLWWLTVWVHDRHHCSRHGVGAFSGRIRDVCFKAIHDEEEG